MMNMRGHNRPPFRPKIPGTDIRSDDVPTAIIYRPSRAITSAPRARHWVLELEPARPLEIEPLMGWTASADPYRSIRMVFPDRESAVGFAESQDWRYIVREDQSKRPKRTPWAGTSRHRLYKGVDAPGAYHIATEITGTSAHRLHFGHDAEQAASGCAS